jgi:3,4-dihydroxy 2-butanone 4-phosphate synthase/GTP cyclohydrolase II
MKDDGTMARLPDLEMFAQEHGLKIGTIADLIHHRSQNETLIERIGQRTLVTPQGPFECTAFRDRSAGLHLALSKGEWGDTDEVPVRVHEPLSLMDLLDVDRAHHSWSLPRALAVLQASQRGLAVLLNCGAESGETLLPQILKGDRPTPAAQRQMDLRLYGIGAQILRELGVKRMKLLGSPRRMPSMTGYGLEVTGFLTPRDAKELIDARR